MLLHLPLQNYWRQSVSRKVRVRLRQKGGSLAANLLLLTYTFFTLYTQTGQIHHIFHFCQWSRYREMNITWWVQLIRFRTPVKTIDASMNICVGINYLFFKTSYLPYKIYETNRIISNNR